MSKTPYDLALRHGALRARIASQRAEFASHAAPLEAALARGDAVLKGVDWLKHHPAAITLAVTAVVVAKPSRAWRWAKRSFLLWRGWQTLKKSLVNFNPK